MPFEKRKVYIEFLGQTNVNLVNMYYNKVIELKENCTIDLVNFKIYDFLETPSSFFANFEYEDMKYFACDVLMKISESRFSTIGSCSIYDNKKVFGGSVWVEK